MANVGDIKRLTRRSEALKSLSFGEPPSIDAKPFDRFPEMAGAIRTFNEQQKRSYDRLKNLLAEALLGSKIIDDIDGGEI